MKTFINSLAVLFILAGGVWILQGINILPGSFMTGRIEWAIYGAIAVLVGAGMLAFARRPRNSPPKG